MDNGSNGRIRPESHVTDAATPRNGMAPSNSSNSSNSSSSSNQSNPERSSTHADPTDLTDAPDLADLPDLGTPPDSPNSTPVPDLIDTLRRTKQAAGHSAEATIGGYAAEHDRPAAFEGSDGQPYTVDVAVAPSEDSERPYAAYLLFLRWAMTGAGIMGHIESGDVAHGSTEEDALRLARELTLYEAKVELDAAIERRRAEGED